MMNVGMTTKNWGIGPEQRSAKRSEQGLEVDKSRKGPAMIGGEDKDLGTILNEIADPNYIDPKKIQREKKSDLDKDAFFKLMLTQMKNQDPMNPMESHEMAAHLAQFTGLEQMFNINANLEAMRNAQSPTQNFQVLQFIGKEVSADSSLIVRNKNDESHELRFNLLGDASEIKVKVKNEQGEVVRDLKLSDLKKGKNVVRWDGFSSQGQKQKDGEFRFEVEALSNSGKKIAIDTEASGKITGVLFTKKGPVLMIGDQQVYMSDVKKIVEKESDVKSTSATPEVPLNTAPIADSPVRAAAPPASSSASSVSTPARAEIPSSALRKPDGVSVAKAPGSVEASPALGAQSL